MGCGVWVRGGGGGVWEGSASPQQKINPRSSEINETDSRKILRTFEAIRILNVFPAFSACHPIPLKNSHLRCS